MKPEDTQFVEAVARVITEFCIGLKGAELDGFLTTSLGKYLWNVNHIIGEINQNLEDIKLVGKLIAGFEPGNRPLTTDDNAAHLIRYHYENYLLRTIKLSDLSLMLINKVMRFELRNGTNLESQLLKRIDPKYGKFDIIWGHMKQLTNQVKPYRNHLAHNGSVRHKDLALLNAHYTYKVKHKTVVDEFRYEGAMTGIQRELVEKFMAEIKAYLIASDQVLTLIYLYLTKPFFDNLKVLVEQHYQNKPAPATQST